MVTIVVPLKSGSGKEDLKVEKSISLKSGSYGSVSYVNDKYVKKNIQVNDSLNLFSAIKEWFCNQRLLSCPGIHTYFAMKLNYETMEIDFFSDNFLYSYNRVLREIHNKKIELTLNEFHDDIIAQSKQVLELLHKKNIVHNDIKHDNIMFNNFLELYFIDFGIAFLKCKNVYNLNHVRAAKYISPPEVIFSNQEYLYTTDKSFIDIYALGVLSINSYADDFPMYEKRESEGKINYIKFFDAFYGSRDILFSKNYINWETLEDQNLPIVKAIKSIENFNIRKFTNQCLQPNPKLRLFYENSSSESLLKSTSSSSLSSSSLSWIPYGRLFVNIWEETKNLECYDIKSHSLAPFLAMEMFVTFKKSRPDSDSDSDKEILIACLYIAVSIYASSLYFMEYNIPLTIKVKIMQVMEVLSDSISEMEDTLIIRKFMENFPTGRERPNIYFVLLFPILREYPEDLKTLEFLVSETMIDSEKDIDSIIDSLKNRWIPLFYSEFYQLNIFIPWNKFFSSFPLSLIHEKISKLKPKS